MDGGEAHSERLWTQLAVIVAVAASHMSMPNHWLPYSMVARAHSWTLRKALFLTFLGATGHVGGTILISVLISGIGGALISHENYRLLSTGVLLVLGAYYLYTYGVQQNRTSCCDRPAGKSSALAPTLLAHAAGREDPAAVHRAAAVSLVLLTTLSPCVGSMPVLISLLAPPVAASTVVAAAGTLLLTSVFVMCSLVAVSYLGAATMDFGRIRRHERLILGLGLVVLAGLTFFVFSDEHKHHHHGEHMMNGNDGEHGMHSHAEHMRMEGGRSEGGALGSGTTGEGQHLEGHMDGEGMLRMLRMPAWMQEWLRPIRRH